MALEIQVLPFILPYRHRARPLRVKDINESDWKLPPEQILPSSREHHPFLSSFDRCVISHPGRDGAERGKRLAEGQELPGG